MKYQIDCTRENSNQGTIESEGDDDVVIITIGKSKAYCGVEEFERVCFATIADAWQED